MTSTPIPEESQPALKPVQRPLSLIPVGLKEAALDSPTFRATAVHFSEQIDLIERWLDGLVRATSRVASDVSSLENHINNFLLSCTPPPQISEAAIDHDYTSLASKLYSDGVRASASSMIRWTKRLENTVAEPIRGFLRDDLRKLKDARKDLEAAQRAFDTALSRYLGQGKTKEASSLREDAFQLHEARKSYLKASMDFCILVPHCRNSLDKLLLKVFSDQWREMKQSRDSVTSVLDKFTPEMDRVRGWSREMENSEMIFRRELAMARRQIEDTAETAARPSRELDSYAIYSVPAAGTAPPGTAPFPSPAKPGPPKSEKQSWLFQKTTTGKPARTLWVRRWFFVKHGIFGWLVQGLRSGAVEESEKIGVLLCGVRPASGEERRFCFEVKTKDTTITLQAETPAELSDWLNSFDLAKRKALEGSHIVGLIGSGTPDPAFAISPPIAPEFAAKTGDGAVSSALEEGSLDRAGTLPVSEHNSISGSLAARGGSVDVSRKSMVERDGESSRDHAARIIQRLDLHRKGTGGLSQPGHSSNVASGGIASLVSATHNVVPIGVGASPGPATLDTKPPPQSSPSSSLAPSTLAIAPAPTNLSKTAVIVSGERGFSISSLIGGIPGGLMANLWGSENWAHVNKLEQRPKKSSGSVESSRQTSPLVGPGTSINSPTDTLGELPSVTAPLTPRTATPPSHRKSASAATVSDTHDSKPSPRAPSYPNYYPLPLKAQDAQFRMLFPAVPRDEHLVLVFRGTWNPNDQQEFPGRVYVTVRDMYFYSHHLGMVLVSGASLRAISEVTAAPGRDCDFIFLHFKEGVRADGATRVTIKIFLEPLKLLQTRLNYLVQNAVADSLAPAEEVLKTLIRMEGTDGVESPSMESWEDVSVNTPVDGAYPRRDHEITANLRVDNRLFKDPNLGQISRNATKFRLPSQPVVYTPQGMKESAMEREFGISAKALFHMIFGDKSTIFHMLYASLCNQTTIRTPWTAKENGNHRRDFLIDGSEIILAYQVIEVLNDHLCYVVSDRRRPMKLPKADNFSVLTKIVITHISKSRSKLGIWTRVDWHRPTFAKGTISRYAMEEQQSICEHLVRVASEQASTVRYPFSSRQATSIYGAIGLLKSDVSLGPQTSGSAVAQIWEGSGDSAHVKGSSLLAPGKLTVPGLIFIEIKQNISCAAGTFGSSFWTGMCNWITALSAHKVLVLSLLICLVFNFFFVSRDGWQWYVERNARSYMKEIGVHPGVVLQKSVRVHEMMDMIHDSHNVTFSDAAAGQSCRSSYQALLLDTVADRAAIDAALSTNFQSSMNRLGSYRHDLLVSLRLVGRVEQQVVQAEWERWLLGESEKCRGMQKVLDANETGDGDAEFEGLKGWWNEYCGDCLSEALKL
ncbi:hypothetical protein P152DRAFT_408610 [Eremomyces bilateralis CBS 781.70]|uniref:Transcription factor SipA3 n=1 Tax=Eremomyces bilateralis CBS 781.70 TaxID=1392243 RepID=A0A6G1GDS6_9PEZI|nr:uncharacterized protein P152DRAFT_408610 [Eremomyces bilateralis CBS 781.70]KAF1816060.1 hypothetical protein P152DRAFT_408610 [Eremomyces bilateralis CBS 781.70]